MWILVRVERGFLTSLTLFKQEADALDELERLSKKINRDYDEVEVFKADLGELRYHDKLTVAA